MESHLSLIFPAYGLRKLSWNFLHQSASLTSFWWWIQPDTVICLVYFYWMIHKISFPSTYDSLSRVIRHCTLIIFIFFKILTDNLPTLIRSASISLCCVRRLPPSKPRSCIRLRMDQNISVRISEIWFAVDENVSDGTKYAVVRVVQIVIEKC